MFTKVVLLFLSFHIAHVICCSGAGNDESTEDENRQEGQQHPETKPPLYNSTQGPQKSTSSQPKTKGTSKETTMGTTRDITTIDPVITQLVVIAGEQKINDSYPCHDDVEIVNIPSSKKRSCKKPPPYPKKILAPAFTYYQHKALVCGGCTKNMNINFGTVYKECYEYVGKENKWKQVTSMSVPRAWFGGVWTKDWKWMVVGGVAGQTYYKSTEMFDPITRKWTKGPDMPLAHFAHCVTYLEKQRNKFLVATHKAWWKLLPRPPGSPPNPSFVFDWNTQTWSNAPPVPGDYINDDGCTVCALTKGISGKVILLAWQGGFSIEANPLGTAWTLIVNQDRHKHGGAIFYDSGIGKLILIGSDDATANIVYRFTGSSWEDSGIKTKLARYHSAIIPMRETTLQCQLD